MWINEVDDELSFFFLPANALENESVKPESCWKLDSGILMNGVDVLLVIEMKK